MSLDIQNKRPESNRFANQESTTNKYPNDQNQNGHRSPSTLSALHDGKQVTEEEYWNVYYEGGGPDCDASYEWNNGILEAKPMPTRLQLKEYHWFHEVLGHFLKVHQIAIMIFLEIGFRMEIPDPEESGQAKRTVRKPDIGVVLDANEIPWLDDQRSYHGTFDMIIESLSDSDKGEVERDTIHKKAEYEAAGVREYFILDPSEKHQRFYRLDANDKYVEIIPQNGLIHSDVLPGFQFRIRDLIEQPTLEEMAQDEVYQGFMLPAYQEALEQIEEERTRADRLAQMLRELGVDEAELQ